MDGTLTSSPEDFPAKSCPLPAAEPESVGSEAACGSSSPELLARFDPASSSWKTRQRSLFEEWATFSGAWPRSGMTRSGNASPQPSLVRITSEIVCSLSPGLPVLVRDCSTAEMQEPFIGAVVYDNDGQVDVETPDGFTDCFPPEWVHRIPTPQASDWKSGKGYLHGDKKQTPQLRHMIGGAINPESCEWLMGFPIGHSELRQ
jgi:hypothetical protein